MTSLAVKAFFDTKGYDRTISRALESDWDKQTEAGTVIHAILESIVNPDKTVSFTDTQYLLFGKTIEDGKDRVETLKSELESVIEQIKAKHPECSILTEVPIISKQLAACFEKTTNSKGELLTSVNGRIDLLVIDKNGVAHIYDYKVSNKEVGG